MNKKEKRIEEIISLLKSTNFISIRELSNLLDVSEMTIRRDIRLLEENRIAKNNSGIVIFNNNYSDINDEQYYDVLGFQQKQNREKENIGKFAASLLEEDDIAIIDTGTTTEKIIPHLPTDKNLTILSFNLNVLMELRKNPGIHILFAGGRYHPNTQMFESVEGVNFINSLRAKKVFLSAAGIHKDYGNTCMHNYEVLTKQAIINSSVEKILLADSTKFDLVRSSYFSDLNQIDTIITDSGISEQWQEYLRNMNIKLYIV